MNLLLFQRNNEVSSQHNLFISFDLLYFEVYAFKNQKLEKCIIMQLVSYGAISNGKKWKKIINYDLRTGLNIMQSLF